MAEARGYPIQVVAQKLGVSTHVLRAWERRYPSIQPDRMPNGRRTYSAELRKRLETIVLLVSLGYRIGDLADLSIEELQQRLANSHQHVARTPERDTPQEAMPEELSHRAIEATLAFDIDRLRDVTEQALAHLGRTEVADGYLFPVIRRLETMVNDGQARSVHVGFLHQSFAVTLAGLLTTLSWDAALPRVIVTTPARARTVVGALAAALQARLSGWQPIWVGTDIPAEEIGFAVESSDARAVVIAAVTDRYDTGAMVELSRLRAVLADGVAVYVGGRVPDRMRDDLAQSGLVHVADMDQLRTHLVGAA